MLAQCVYGATIGAPDAFGAQMSCRYVRSHGEQLVHGVVLTPLLPDPEEVGFPFG